MGDQSYRYLTVDEMKSLGDDSMPMDMMGDERRNSGSSLYYNLLHLIHSYIL